MERSNPSLVIDVAPNRTAPSSQRYPERDLLDILVVDSEGYIRGRVSNFDIKSNVIAANLYDYETKQTQVPDEEQLVQKLLPLVPKKRFSRQEPNKEELYNWIHGTNNLTSKQSVTLKHLIDLAEHNKIDVPYKTQEVKEKTEKGTIPWHMVDKIAFSDLGKCIFLKESIEAKKKGVYSSFEVPYKSTEDLKGKLILDSDAKIVGSAVRFLVGDTPGLLINVEKVTKERRADAESLKRQLIPSRFDNADELSKKMKKILNLETITDDDIVNWAKKNGFTVQYKLIDIRVAMEFSVKWHKIAKIGDVIILKRLIEDITQETDTDSIDLPGLQNADSKRGWGNIAKMGEDVTPAKKIEDITQETDIIFPDLPELPSTVSYLPDLPSIDTKRNKNTPENENKIINV